MKGEKGYTILEVLIFVAVSALIFVAAVGAISGRQAQVQFSQATREFEAKIKDIINDVTTGYFPSNGQVQCAVISGSVSLSDGSNVPQGTSDQCLSIGKVIQFNPSSRADQITIFSLAGKRFVNGLQPVSTIAEAEPIAVAKPDDATFNGTEETYTTLYGLRVTGVIRPISTTNIVEYGSVGIMSTFGGTGLNASQSVQIGGIIGSSLGQDKLTAVNIINQLTDADPPTATGYFDRNTEEGVVICLESVDGKTASLTLGVKGSAATELQIDNRNEACEDI